jgi:hypothetical protein
MAPGSLYVSRLKRGWRIHLTDNEMAALREVVAHGLADFEDPKLLKALANGVRRVLTSDRWRSIEGPLSIDDDRRTDNSNQRETPGNAESG